MSFNLKHAIASTANSTGGFLKGLFLFLVGVTALAFGIWLLLAKGIVEILRVIIDTAEAGFKHDWKLAEVVLVLLLLVLIVRKR
jgi:uncharacterized membrane protein